MSMELSGYSEVVFWDAAQTGQTQEYADFEQQAEIFDFYSEDMGVELSQEDMNCIQEAFSNSQNYSYESLEGQYYTNGYQESDYSLEYTSAYTTIGTTASGDEIKVPSENNSSDDDEFVLRGTSKYDEYLKDNENGENDWTFDRHTWTYSINNQEANERMFGMIDTDGHTKISRGMGSDYNVYCEWEYMEEWANEDYLYKTADDTDNDGIYEVKYYDSNGNIGLEGVDTDLDGVVDTDVKVNNNCDGKIDDINQGGSGDCWLLSSINSMSYTQEGSEIIKNAIDVQDDGSTIVHTYLGDYTVTLDELKEAKLTFAEDGETSKYSIGDDDMLVLELVTERVLNEYSEGKIDLPSGIDLSEKIYETCGDLANIGDNILDGKSPKFFYYMMTGKAAETTIGNLGIKNALDDIEDGNTVGAECSFLLNDKTLEGPDGNVTVAGNHTYAIKEVKGDVVTLVNPWDSSEEIIVYKSEVLNRADKVTTFPKD